MPCVTIQVVQPGRLEVVDIRAERSRYTAGEDARIYVTVRNTGGTSASGELVITVDGVEKIRKTITVGAGTAEEYEVTIPASYILTPKTYTICAEIR